MSYREKEEKRMIIVEPHVQYRTLKAAEDTFTAIEIALNQLSMKDVRESISNFDVWSTTR